MAVIRIAARRSVYVTYFLPSRGALQRFGHILLHSRLPPESQCVAAFALRTFVYSWLSQELQCVAAFITFAKTQRT